LVAQHFIAKQSGKKIVESMVHQDNDDFMTVLHCIFNHFFTPIPYPLGEGWVWALVLQQFVETLCSIFVKVAQGQILLTAHSRFTLIQELSRVMLHWCDKDSARWTSTKTSITELIGSLPLLDQAVMFQNLHTHHEFQVILDEAYDNWFKRVICKYDAKI
jgi:hypothetical protein